MRTADAERVDVLVVGAGLSGIGAACHLSRHCPDRTVAIVEARERVGGTWDLFRYPGVRSDSDMHTLGYAFAPWEAAEAIADGSAILRYVTETARRHGVLERVRTGHEVVAARWCRVEGRWTVDVRRADTGEPHRFSAAFLLMCTGYYRYDEGYTPPFPGVERFGGPVVHPQHWPPDLDYASRGVLVIGSGATAVTLVPAMAGTAAHVTMLQRSPSYVISMPVRDALAQWLRRWLPSRTASQAVRAKNVGLMMLSYQLSRRRPALMRELIRRGAQRELPDGFAVDVHFRPAYNPWDQRLCIAPDGDLFAAVRGGRASVVTDEIETFTERGVRLRGGDELEADVIVTATGLQMLALGGVALKVDGVPVNVPDRIAYKAMMLNRVPNLAFTVGYTNASWTLKADLTARYVCRVLNHMRRHGYDRCAPVDDGPTLTREPLINLSSGYVRRAVAQFPSQGSRRPWRVHQNYARDLLEFRLRDVEDGVLRFSRGDTPGSAGAVGVPGRLRALAGLASG